MYQNIPSNHDAPLLRPRLNALLQSTADDYPLTAVIGGSKTGKTIAVSMYARAHADAVVWLDAMRRDNLGAHLWKRLLESLRPSLPSLAAALRDTPMQPSLPLADAFLAAWHEQTQHIPSVLCVIDNFQVIENPEIISFLVYLLEARLSNLSLVIISNRKEDWTLRGHIRHDHAGLIAGETLAFTNTEIAQLLMHRQVFHTQNHVARILENTGGWCFAVDRAIAQLAARPALHVHSPVDLGECFMLLQNEWYLPYNARTRQALIRLSLLPVFSVELVRRIAGEADLFSIMTDLREHMFITFDATCQRFYLQTMFRQFLLQYADLLDEAETNRIYQTAGEWFFQHGDWYDSLSCYAAGGQAENGITMIAGQNTLQKDAKLRDFVRESIERQSPSYLEEHPYMRLMLAHIRIIERDMEGAVTLLYAMQAELSLLQPTEAISLLEGEIALCLAEISLLQTQADGIDYYKKAHDLLPRGSEFPHGDRLLLANESTLLFSQVETGDLARMSTQYEEAADYGTKPLPPFSKGLASLLAAEAALVTSDIRGATEKVYEALRFGLRDKDHDLVCNAFFVAGRLAMLKGRHSDLIEVITDLDEYIQQHALGAQHRAYCDSLMGWYYLQIGEWDRIPTALRDPHTFIKLPQRPRTCRALFVQCAYLVHTGKYERALIAIEVSGAQAKQKQQWMVYIALVIQRAICHLHLGHVEEAIEAFREAYRLAYPTGIVTHFIEGGQAMRTLINTVRRMPDHDFDEEWLAMVYRKATTYAKRMHTLAHQLPARKQDKQPAVQLSPREKEVLSMLCTGLTREEVGARLGITVHGVKRHISSLYNKLGAINRSNAIRIADSMGLLRDEAAGQ